MGIVDNKQDSLLIVEGLKQYFGKGRSLVKAVDDVSFEIKKGQIYGLVGESGSGKTTVGRSVIRIYDPTGGSIRFKGTEITGKLDKDKKQLITSGIQMIFQDPYSSLNPAKTVRFILEEPLKNLTDLGAEDRLIRATERLNQAGLDEKYLDRKPSELSGGQRQRVCIAHEPVSALDVTIQAQILKLLDDLQENLGLSILFISHDLRVVYNICDRVMVIREGVIVEEGPVDEVYKNPTHEYTKQLLKASGIA